MTQMILSTDAVLIPERLFTQDAVDGSTLVIATADLGAMKYAHEVFSALPNTLISIDVEEVAETTNTVRLSHNGECWRIWKSEINEHAWSVEVV